VNDAAHTREVADRVFCCEQPDGPRLIRQVVISGDAAALVVDTGLPGSPSVGILPLLDRLAVEPIILLTHPDADHVGGTAEILACYPATSVLAGSEDVALTGDPQRAIQERYACFSRVDDVPFTAAMQARATERFGGAFPAPKPVADGFVIDLGDRQVEVVATPGHSPGHRAAWLATERVAAAGDAVMGGAISDRDANRYIPPMYTPPSAYRATITRLATLQPRLLVLGHEPIMAAAAAAAFLTVSSAACDEIGCVVADAISVAPATLMTLCGRVHAAYGGLPADRVRDFAMTVAGHATDLADTGRIVIEPGPPRTFRAAT
jgi:glyoxylase-like metal-dependent hydrolase (beta-lactamase superfamily II)